MESEGGRGDGREEGEVTGEDDFCPCWAKSLCTRDFSYFFVSFCLFFLSPSPCPVPSFLFDDHL